MLCGERIEIVATNLVAKTIKNREEQNQEKHKTHV